MASSPPTAAPAGTRAVPPEASPIPFPEPKFIHSKRIIASVYVPDESSGNLTPESTVKSPRTYLKRNDSMAGNVLVRMGDKSDPDRAYWIQRKMNKTTYGSVRVGFVLRPRVEEDDDEEEEDDNVDNESGEKEEGGAKKKRKSDVVTGGEKSDELEFPIKRSILWEVVPSPTGADGTKSGAIGNASSRYEMVAIKMYEKSKISALKGRRMEDPMVELAALQMVAKASLASGESSDAGDGACHHVAGTNEILEDDRFIYSILPYSGDDLFHYVEGMGRLEEGVARYFFRQILKGLALLQRIGICHRDISLENVLLKNTECKIIGMSMCLLVPYSSASDDDSSSTVTDVSNGTVPRLIRPQGQCGRPHYMAPEILSNDRSFDGYGVDLWAAGVVLFHMLFGKPPFVWAARDDPWFHLIAINGNLRSFVEKWTEEGGAGVEGERKISDEGVDLLQKMLNVEPSDRVSLEEVMGHPWMMAGSEDEDIPPPLPSTPV